MPAARLASRPARLAAGAPALCRAAPAGLAAPARAQARASARRSDRLAVRASDKSSPLGDVDVDEMVSTLSEKWDKVENKGQVGVYAAASLVALWVASTVVGAINAIPLMPRLMELVGLGYTTWFVYRYLLFKESRTELASDIEALKDKVSSNIGGQ